MVSGVLQSPPEGIGDKRIRDRGWWRYVSAEGLGRALIPLCWVGKFYLGRVGDERLGLINWFLFEGRIFFFNFSLSFLNNLEV